MFPGMDKRSMEAAMRKLGVQQKDLDAVEVIIRLRSGSEIVVSSPSVSKVSMMGQETFQVAGPYSERKPAPSISQDDIDTVASQAGCSPDEARLALLRADGDIAAAILSQKKG